MIRYALMTVLVGMTLLSAGESQELVKLKAEKEALELKLQAYELKKKILEMEKFIEQEKMARDAKIEREKALIKLKNDLRANRENSRVISQRYAG